MILVMMVGPGLISQDMRFNALPLYFSRPLRRIDYFAGKLGVVFVFLAAVAILPAVLGYLLGILFSFHFSVLTDTARVLGGSIVYGILVVASAGTLMLAFSSLFRRSLYVGIAWATLWLVSAFVGEFLTLRVHRGWCRLISYTGNLEQMRSALLGKRAAIEEIGRLFDWPPPPPEAAGFTENLPWYWSALVLAGLFGISVWILNSRVKSLDRLR
jgi:ABC-2 type transport system permease protein